VLLNTWKHHAAALRFHIHEAARTSDSGLDALAGQLVVIGTELMDLYTGQLTPAEVGVRIVSTLQADARLELTAYRAWLSGGSRLPIPAPARAQLPWGPALGRRGRPLRPCPPRSVDARFVPYSRQRAQDGGDGPGLCDSPWRRADGPAAGERGAQELPGPFP